MLGSNNMLTNRPLILDFDGALRDLSGAEVLPFADWQEVVRFGCGLGTWRKLRQEFADRLPASHGTVLLGSGDFHHLTHLLVERLSREPRFDVVVCDNHPDNMRFPFGIHCGSWVRHVAALPQVRRVHVVGITSADIGWRHAWENHLWSLYAGKLRYWSVGVDTGWARLLGLAAGFSSHADKTALVDAFIEAISADDTPVYLSIDKDVLASHVARTNWDQGCFDLPDLQRLIEGLSGRLIGSDITGDVSIHRYRTWWKRWLSALDAQPAIDEAELSRWQAQQGEVNIQLLAWIAAATGDRASR